MKYYLTVRGKKMLSAVSVMQEAGIDYMVEYGMTDCVVSDACATKVLEWNGNVFSAEIVQSVYFASLNRSFADIRTCREYFPQKGQ